jgi:hypothetical protein
VKNMRGTPENTSPTAKSGAATPTPADQNQVERTSYMRTGEMQVDSWEKLQTGGVAGPRMSKEQKMRKFDMVRWKFRGLRS